LRKKLNVGAKKFEGSKGRGGARQKKKGKTFVLLQFVEYTKRWKISRSRKGKSQKRKSSKKPKKKGKTKWRVKTTRD